MKSIAIGASIIAIVGIIGFLLFLQQKGKSPTVNTQVSETGSASLPKPQSKYIAYSNGILENNVGKNRILFFYANWCSTCRPVDKELTENSDKIPEGFVVIRVNYNDTDTDKEEGALAKKYGITYQHTFVEIDKSGDVIQSWNGGSLEELLSRIDR